MPDCSEKPQRPASKPYRVFVDDNFRFSDEGERYLAAEFDAYEDAVARCREIVDASLREAFKPGMDEEALEFMYRMFGEDPWISDTPDGVERFSAWEYARKRGHEIVAGEPA